MQRGRKKKLDVRDWVLARITEKPRSLADLSRLFRKTSIDATHTTLYSAIRELHGVHPKWPDAPRRIHIGSVVLIKGRLHKRYELGDKPDCEDAKPSTTYAAEYARRKRAKERGEREADEARKEAERRKTLKRRLVPDVLTAALFAHIRKGDGNDR